MRKAPCVLLLACSLTLPGAGSVLRFRELQCESAVNPIGLDSPRPRLSWVLESDRRGARQTAYQIQVASTAAKLDAPDLWETGRVLSGDSIQIEYRGRPLRSRERAYWRVRVWDQAGTPTAFSAPAFWEMGLLKPSDWQASWIGYPAGWPGRALYFRNDFRIAKPVVRARIYAAGLGYSVVRLNGARAGDHVLDPAWTDYSKRVLYVTHDVTAMIRQGRNVIGAVVGNGWYGMPKLLMQLEVDFADGTSFVLPTRGGHANPTWRASSGPILANSIYDGETYDARLEKPGWDSPERERRNPQDRTEGWSTVVPVEPPGGRMVAQALEPIKVVESLRPKSVTEPKPGIAVFDTGQNLAGWAELKVSGPRGTEVTLRFAENLHPDGTVNQENLRKAAATDVYILKGEGLEVWEPSFTYHGFRYVQVEGLPGRPSLDSIRVKVVRSAVEANGVFESSNELLNRIHRMVWWTEASNLHGVPTDCPQRDERHGWMNDLTVRMEEAIYNFRLSRFLPKFLNDVRDTQNAEGAIADTVPFRWGFQPADPVSASYLLLGWLPYQHYADLRSLREHYDGFKAWTDYLHRRSKDGIVDYGRYGDWSPPRDFSIDNSPVSKTTPPQLMSTGYLYYCARLLSQMAPLAGKPADAAKYKALANQIAAAFNRKYWDTKTGGYGSNDQSSNSFALYLEIVPKERVARVVENLARDVRERGNHLTTGNLCTKYVLEALSDHGHADVAFQIATQTTYPGWGNMLANGATTLWERWEHLTGGQMNSHNHPMMGSVGAWFFRYLGGIRPDGPGFKRIVLRPYPVSGLDWAKTEYKCPYGVIRSAWSKENGGFTYRIAVPVNTTATVFVPAPGLASVREGGKPVSAADGEVQWLGDEEGTVKLRMKSGEYEFRVAP